MKNGQYETYTHREVLQSTTRRMEEGRVMKVHARHLDGSSSALTRNQELQRGQ